MQIDTANAQQTGSLSSIPDECSVASPTLFGPSGSMYPTPVDDPLCRISLVSFSLSSKFDIRHGLFYMTELILIGCRATPSSGMLNFLNQITTAASELFVVERNVTFQQISDSGVSGVVRN